MSPWATPGFKASYYKRGQILVGQLLFLGQV